MCQRKNINAIEKHTVLREALNTMLNENTSRFPVYDENIDNITGVLHLRDVMRAYLDGELQERAIDCIDGLIREADFVPESKNIATLFQSMQKAKTQMVIVVDEYGQTAGLIAMEDILEEIVGNILDEYDEEEAYIAETADRNQFLIDGMTPLAELEERFGISFAEEEYETLNGFLIARMDKIPAEDEQFDIDVDGCNFKIETVENRMVKHVLVTTQKTGSEGDDGEDET
jgi:putative hemolysin